MRRLLLAVVLAASAVTACSSAVATPRIDAETPRPGKGVVLLVQTQQHLEVALDTANQLVAEPGVSAVHVLACGNATGALRSGGPLEARVASLDRRRIRVVACGISLQRAGIDPASLAPGVEVVPNAIVEAVHLQSEGFLSVEL